LAPGEPAAEREPLIDVVQVELPAVKTVLAQAELLGAAWV
jgi:hypothetical protein